MIRNGAFRRLERDEEFRARMKAAVPKCTPEFVTGMDLRAGASLDEYVWSAVKMQRRIVDDVS